MDFRIIKKSGIRVLPRPRQGLRALAERAPQAEAFAESVMERLRPALRSLYHVRRRLATGCVAVLTVWLFVHVMFGANGMVVYRQKKTEYQSLQKEIDELQQQNNQSNQQIKALKTDPKTIEKAAREELHYARPGEVVFVTPTPPQPQRPSTDAARK
jgi:cell division protein FtsB